MRSHLTGRVEELRRGLWLLIVNMPPEHLIGRDRPKYPKVSKRVSAKGVRDARADLRTWITELEQKRCTDPRRLTVAGLLEQWLAAVKPPVLRPASHEFYKSISDNHLVPKIGKRIAADMRRGDFSAYFATGRAAGLSETTLSHHKATMSAAYSWAIEAEILQSNPLWHFRRGPQPQPRKLTVWDHATIAAAVVLARGTQAHATAVLGGWCGLRPSEVCAVRFADADLRAGILTVKRSVEETDDGLQEFAPKGGVSRVAPLPSAAVAELEMLRVAHDVERLRRPGWNSERRILCRRDGEQMTPSGMASTWSGFVRRRALPKLSPHGLRHSYGTIVCDADGLKVAQAWLGHTKESTTMIYHHRTDQALVAAISRLERETAEAVAKAVQDSLLGSDPITSLTAYRAKKSCK